MVVINEQGDNLGTFPTRQAIDMAKEKDLDLIEVAPLAKPPVCKIMDYGRFQYQQSRSQPKAKKVETKGLRLSFKIGQHDMEVRQKQTEKFFSQGHKVKIELRLKGREKAFKDRAREVMEQFLEGLSSYKIEAPLKQQGGTLTIIISKK
ncbi:translation initiation factor IF-3 [Candidatus Nomurabacteria bacterium]|nr:translation initiation factor IF-3 [Candidatus Nomurabacteria bacterium]